MFNPQQSRTLAVSGEALPSWGGRPVLVPSRVTGTEKFGRLYRYTLELITADDPTLPVYEAQVRVQPDKLVGTEIAVSFEFDGKGEFIAGLPGGSGLGNVGAGTRTIIGLITAVHGTGANDRHAFYQFTVRPWLWLATRNRENRIFQNQSVVEITETVLTDRRYPFTFELRLAAPGLRGVYPKRDYVRQFWESDYDFLTRLWREWGLYFFMEGATLVLCDSPGSHQRHGNMYDTITWHAPDGARIDEEHIHTLKVSRALTAGVVSLTDYDSTQSLADLRVTKDDGRDEPFANAEHYGWGNYSQPLAGKGGLAGTPNEWQGEGGHLARVRVDALRCRRLRAKGRGNLRGLATGHTFHLKGHPDRQVNAEYLVIATTLDIRNVDETSQPAGGQARYRCATDFVLQPANVFFRNRPREKPRCGPETAVVVGPEKQAMWVDGYARVKVQFIWDRHGKRNENSSCWVRVASPWQGSGFGTIYLPRIGQEVEVSYHEGNPDRPYVSSRMVNQFNQPPWVLPDNQALSGTRSRDLEGMQANQIVTDDTPGKLQVQVSSDHAQSRLVLGYNTRIDGNAGRKEARGIGWELATDAWGVLRANRGMLITTETRAGATAPVKEMGETVQRLTQARQQHEDLSQLAQRHRAQDSDVRQSDATAAMNAQNDALRGSAGTDDNRFPEMTRADLAIASAAGFAVTATESVHLVSERDHAVTAGRDISISGGRSLIAAVRGAVSLFAAQFGIRLFAGKGKVEIQAQGDAMALAALKDLTITSTDGKIILSASKEIWIGAGGSYIQINGSGIINGSPGPILEKTPKWGKPAASFMRCPLPVMPVAPLEQNPAELYTQKFDVSTVVENLGDGLTVANQPYRIYLPDGTLKQQGMLTDGATLTVSTAEPTMVRCEIGAGDWCVTEDAYDHHELEDGSEQA